MTTGVRLTECRPRTVAMVKRLMADEIEKEGISFVGPRHGTIIFRMNDPVGYLNEVANRPGAEEDAQLIKYLIQRIRRKLVSSS